MSVDLWKDFIVLIFFGSFVLTVFFLLTLQTALERCSPECRTTSPGSVWGLLIPFYNVVWYFILVSKISESLHNEFAKRNILEDIAPGKSLGIANGICQICLSITMSTLGVYAFIASIICWTFYWVKISSYSTKLSKPIAE